MNTETTETKRPIRTAAMLVGTVTVVILIAWLSIKIVNNVPGSFASLASLAETVRTYNVTTDSEENTSPSEVRNMLIVTSDTNVVSTGEQVRLSWTESQAAGSYVFSFKCIDGVAIDIADVDGSRNISCETNYNLGDTNTVTLKIDSEKERYVDIPYTLSFLGTNDTTPRATDEALLTVVNNTIGLTIPSETVGGTISEPVTTPEEVSETNEPTTPVTTPQQPTFTQEYTYTIPVSDPNGRIDISTRFISVGRIIGNSFFAQTVDNDFPGAIQFEVKNLGTKTSNTWKYSVALPSGGQYESDTQAALKPNERAVITIGFPESSVTSHDFEVTITTSNDAVSTNNSFEQRVVFLD